MKIRKTRRRRGLIAIGLVIALMVLLTVSTGLLRVVLARQADGAMAVRRLQAETLAESGLDRASARLAAKADYRGETWTIPAADLGGRQGGVVTIAVGPVAGHDDRRAVRVRAEYPASGDRRAVRSRGVVIDLAPSTNPNPTHGTDRKGETPR